MIDWLPTLLAAAGTRAPAGHAVDGIDLRPALRGEPLPPRALYWYLPLYDLRWAATPCAVIREGDWKLIEHFGDSFDAAQRYRPGRKLELFNLRADLGEQHDLAAREPGAHRAARRPSCAAGSNPFRRPVPGPNPHADPARRFLETREKQPWNR